jgi:hypothetical protein
MNSVPYSMLLTSKTQAVGMLSDVALEHLAQTSSISATISQAKALPIQVLMPVDAVQEFLDCHEDCC